MLHYDTMEEPKSAEEKRWRAESDARTLAESTIIQGDEKRLKAAQKAAKKMAELAKKEADQIKEVARLKYPTMEK